MVAHKSKAQRIPGSRKGERVNIVNHPSQEREFQYQATCDSGGMEYQQPQGLSAVNVQTAQARKTKQNKNFTTLSTSSSSVWPHVGVSPSPNYFDLSAVTHLSDHLLWERTETYLSSISSKSNACRSISTFNHFLEAVDLVRKKRLT